MNEANLRAMRRAWSDLDYDVKGSVECKYTLSSTGYCAISYSDSEKAQTLPLEYFEMVYGKGNVKIEAKPSHGLFFAKVSIRVARPSPAKDGWVVLGYVAEGKIVEVS